jgi:hypothetical protein
MTQPSFKGFMECLMRGVRAFVRGKGFTSKFRLAVWALLDSMPRALLRAFPFLKTPLQAIKDEA